MKKALITGITGQDGSYLAELLLEKGYHVFGIVRRSSFARHERINHIVKDIEIIDADLLDQISLIEALRRSRADEVYNLAAMSFVGASFQQPVATGEYTGLSVARMLDAIRVLDRPIRFYQASTSEMYGKVREVPQDERTGFYPRSPYGIAKLYGHWMTVNSRESYGIYACSGILFNHESPRRGHEFVTRKITRGVARIVLGMQKRIVLGNLEARRDWGYAGDYVEAMWRMLQQEKGEEYVIATGVGRSVREFVKEAFGSVGIEEWWRYVEEDVGLRRPAEVEELVGDARKAQDRLGWRARTTFEEMVRGMVRNDLEECEREGRR